MNNYYNYQNYLNQVAKKMNPPTDNMNSLKNEGIVNQNQMNMGQMNKKIYEPYEGFIKGSMFPELYKPYKIANPYEIKPMNEQAELLTYIDALGFAMIDLNLYLDLYPNDRNMIERYNQYRMQKEEFMKQYESKFGPLVTTSDALKNYPWAWDNRPWPWENK